MDSDTTGATHPAYADIIRQLLPTEAQVLRAAFAADIGIDLIRYSVRRESGTSHFLRRGIIPVRFNGAPWVVPELSSYIDNWVRLGLFTADLSRTFTHEERYAWVEDWPSTVEQRQVHGEKLEIQRGGLNITEWGQRFAHAVNRDVTSPNPFGVVLPEFFETARARALELDPSFKLPDTT